MTDIYSTQKRSDIMSRIRSTGSKPEVRLIEIVSEVFHNYELVRNCRDVTGSPDIFFPALNTAFFLDGCFFHACPTHGHMPKTNVEYWQKKILGNVKRDRRNRRTLRGEGMSVWRFWEHDVKNKYGCERTRRRVELALSRNE